MRTTTLIRSAACSAALLLAALAHAQSCGEYAWTQLQTPTAPSSRSLATMVYDEARDRLVLFGGYAATTFSDETWEYDFASARWIPRESAMRPPARAEAAMVYDTLRKRTLLFGGTQAPGVHNNDTWVWDGNTWSALRSTPPPPRTAHAMVYDPIRDVVVLYGGVSEEGYLGDTWEFTPTTGTWTEVAPATSPGPRSNPIMTFDPRRARPILFGGVFTGTYLADTWEYAVEGSGHEWTKRSNSGPSPRLLASMVTDSARGRVFLFGGYATGGSLLDDLWEWNGTTATWTQLTPNSAAPARSAYSWAFCPMRGSAFLHGGYLEASPYYAGDTWRLTFAQAPVITSHPTSVAVAEGRAAVLRVQAAGAGLTYQWRRGGQPLMPSDRHLGITTPTLTILGVHASDIGEYDVVVTNACGTATSSPASISVTCSANCDGSTTPPVLNVNDFLCFQQKFAAGCP